MHYGSIFNYKNIFIGISLGGVIYSNVISPFIQLNEEKEKILKIPTEFSGTYIINTSSTLSAIAFPIIPTFYN